ncbi:hypothetical protein CANARDRAFT_194901 [[Candida] arabinofermentans NRRL YB-2248]|uniref:DNA damage-binding protein 1 n=1 Tax=[Candida] arabinofermentans NRRL YB-2248 TaxID=983967 RepID=A0A1E4T6N7_9ASCO|nr:hypothetical protein CANARDRAFT_194901 [[Candida] arabinofermentans NRRL YB-2248]
MSDTHPELELYNLTLQPSVSAVKCCIGNFTGNKKQQEVVRATNTAIELWKLNKKTGQLVKAFSQDTYSNIRSIQNFKITKSLKDSLIITSDSGNLAIVEFDNNKGRFRRASCEPYSKTGIRRIGPGEFIATDGEGRAAMIAAIEKNKLVYTFRKDSNDDLLVSSPLEANKNNTLTFDLTGLDVGFDNPMFASIECDYSNFENDSTKELYKTLSYYELDLGLNHVVRKYSEDINNSSNFVIAIPGGVHGPSGVLISSDGMVQYKYLNKMAHSVPIPKRTGQVCSSRIVAGVVHRLKKAFFVLLQSDQGDLFKVTLDYSPQDSDESNGEGGIVDHMEIKYFDSLPICTSLLIFKAGFLYANCESGDQYVYQFEKLGDDPNDKVFTSTNYPDDVAVLEDPDTFFDVKPLDNLNLVSIIENLNPLIDSKLYDSGNASDLPVIYSLCGSGPRSSMKILNHELPFSEIVSQELPSVVQKVFATKLSKDDVYDKFMILSFVDGTLVLGIGEEVEEVENSGFVSDTNTFDVQQIGSTSVVQIHPHGIRQIFYKDGEPQKNIDWNTPTGIEIVCSSCTNTQVVVGLSNRELAYFEIDEFDRLIEYNERKEMDAQITSVSLGDLPQGKSRFPFIVVGCKDSSLTILSCDPSDPLETISKEVLSATAHSLLIRSMKDSTLFINSEIDVIDEEDNTQLSTSVLYVHIGMENGVYARLQMDLSTGELSNPRNKYTGPSPVSLAPLRIGNENVVSIISTRTYLGYTTAGDFKITPLTKPTFQHMCSFKSEDVPSNGVLSIHGKDLLIMTIDQLDSDFLIESINLRYTPKAMQDCSDLNGMLYVAESDYQLVTYELDEEKIEYCQQFGYEYKEDSWGSCLQVISVEDKAVGQTIELIKEAAFKVCKVKFNSHPNDDYLVVSTSTDQRLNPNSNSGSYLRVYKIQEDGSLEFLHKTKVDSLSLSIIQFQNGLLVGSANSLTLYDLGLKQLLKKASTKLNCQQIVDMKTQGFRVVVSDIRDSVRFVVYKPLEGKFIEFVDDSIQRHITKTVMVDYDTILGGDKFGNLFVLRCPQQISELSDEENHGALLINKEQKLNGTAYRLNNLFNFYVGDIPTSFEVGSLTMGGTSCIVYTCLQGKIGCLHAMKSLSEINFFKELQKFVIQELELLTDRSYLKFRSYYTPIKGCIDGDLVEEYYKLSNEKRVDIATKMDRLPRDIDKRISEMRSRVAY